MAKQYVKPTIMTLGSVLPDGLGQCARGSVANTSNCSRGGGTSTLPTDCRNGAIASSSGSPNCNSGGQQ